MKDAQAIITEESGKLCNVDPLDQSHVSAYCRAMIGSALQLSDRSRREYMDYYVSEEAEISKQSAWDDVVEAFKSGKKSQNPSNLLCLYLLGMTTTNPMDWYFVTRSGPGKESCWVVSVEVDDGRVSEAAVSKDQPLLRWDETVGDFVPTVPSSLAIGDAIAHGRVVGIKKTRGSLQKTRRGGPDDVGFVGRDVALCPTRLCHQWEVSNDVPDVDTDFSPWVRNELKQYATEVFGKDNVVSICNYNCFGAKSALKDCARIFGVPYLEANALTTTMSDDADRMAWEDVCEAYPQVFEFEQKYPEVVKIARRLIGRRRSIGKHASGISIASVPVDDFIPLVTKEGFSMSSYSEGLGRSDLKTFGFVKFDFLGLDTLDDIDKTVQTIKSRYVTVPTSCGVMVYLKTKPLVVTRDGVTVTVTAGDLVEGDVVEEAVLR